MAASGPARPRQAVVAGALVWAVLPLVSVGCAAEADRGVSPMEDQLGDPEVPWHQRDERRGAEPTPPVAPTPAPKTSKE